MSDHEKDDSWLPMYRSQTMAFVRLFIPRESLDPTIRALGQFRGLHLVDVRTKKTPRSFMPTIRSLSLTTFFVLQLGAAHSAGAAAEGKRQLEIKRQAGACQVFLRKLATLREEMRRYGVRYAAAASVIPL